MTDFERRLRAIAISLLVHGALVGVVFWLWSRPPEKSEPETSPWNVDLFMTPPAAEMPVIDDTLPQPPDAFSEPSLADVNQPLSPLPDNLAASDLPATVNDSGPSSAMPNLSLSTGAPSIGAIAVPVMAGSTGYGGSPRLGAGPGSGAYIGSAFNGGSELSPIVRIPPNYPLDARRKKIEGWVKIEFTVQEDGSVSNAKVKAAEPSGIFEQAAIAAIEQWKFNPATENGKTVRRRVAQTLKFELNE